MTEQSPLAAREAEGYFEAVVLLPSYCELFTEEQLETARRRLTSIALT